MSSFRTVITLIFERLGGSIAQRAGFDFTQQDALYCQHLILTKVQIDI
jgi:hypothetical protein